MPTDIKHLIRLPDGFDFLSEDDFAQPFETGDIRMDRYALREYYGRSRNPNNLVIVYRPTGLIAGIIEITVHERFVAVEMLGKNARVEATAVGTKLMSLAEGIACQLGKDEIRLESLDTVVDWYDNWLGYVEYSEPYYDPEFGRLIPKRKPLR